MITAPKVIFVIVLTAAVMALAFIFTLASLLFLSPGLVLNSDASVLFDKLLSAFVTAGMSAMSFLFGMLANTRTQAAPAPETPVPVKQVNTDAEPGVMREVKSSR